MKKVCSLFIAILLAVPSFVCASAIETKAKAAVVMDCATGAVIYSKNENKRLSMASTTKIMTAIIVLENADLDKEYTVKYSEAATEGSALGISAGDVLSVKSLLYGLLIVSGNDAAAALADAVAGDEKSFVELMNEKAKQLGLENTHFSNPSGLTDKKHYSSALDMAVLTKYALSNKLFSKIVSLSDTQITFSSPKKTISLHNHNRLLGEYEGCIGVKTGYTENAGRCLVSAAKRKGQTVIAVTLSDPDDWNDHKKMLDYAFSHSEAYSLNLNNAQIPVVGAQQKTVGVTYPETEVYLPEGELKYVSAEIYSYHFLYAPVKKGEIIAQAVIFYKGRELKRINLYSNQNVKLKKSNKAFWKSIIYGKFGNKTSKIYG